MMSDCPKFQPYKFFPLMHLSKKQAIVSALGLHPPESAADSAPWGKLMVRFQVLKFKGNKRSWELSDNYDESERNFTRAR